MKALVLNALGRGFDLDEVDIASPTGREVLVDVQASGLCHTDLLFATHDIAPPPSVLGHEVAGIVAAVGPDVTQVRVGDRIVGSLAQACGGCARCLSGRPFQCLHPESTLRRVMLECIDAAGLPKGVCNVVIGRGNTVGAELVRNPDVDKISFTGSVAVGESIMRDGAATMKRVTLELGGKSPTIVLDDATLNKAIPAALMMAFLNSGQACAAGTRLLVPRSRLDEVKRGIRDAMSMFTVGDPADPNTAIGPMVSQKQYERVQSYIRKGIEEGAEVLAGGEGHPAGLEAGYFMKPTVFVNVRNDMTIAQEEIFGPVLSVIAYDSEDEAIRIANDSKYGLHAAVLGTDLQRAHRVASQIRAGRVVINGMTDDPQAPWGGFKFSGVGREYGRYGIEAFLETRAILES
jgi:aldehyde dehydrogenase (NAD+)